MAQNFVGYAATIVASTSLMPQVYKVYETKSAKDVSFGMIVMIMIASILWHIHGWIQNDTPLRVSTSITILVNAALCVLKLRYSKDKK